MGGTPQSSHPLGNPWMYTARFTDEETGLYYYRARYYSPETGRFLQRDPLGVAAGPNLYEYVHSSPVRYRDPSGLDVHVCWRPLKLDSGGDHPLADHAYIKITEPGKPPKYYGYFQLDGGAAKVLTSGRKNRGHCRHPKCVKVERTVAYNNGWAPLAGAEQPPEGDASVDTAASSEDTCALLPPKERRCCRMTEAEIKACIDKAAHDAPKVWNKENRYTCGDWAADALSSCCLKSDAVPISSSGQRGIPALRTAVNVLTAGVWGWVVDALTGQSPGG